MEQHLLLTRAESDPRKLLEKVFGILGIFRRGWRYIAVSVAISLMLATIYLARAKSTYEASARLLILQHGGHPLNAGGNQLLIGGDPFQPNGYANTLATHVMVIKSPVIVAVALGPLRGVSAGTIIGDPHGEVARCRGSSARAQLQERLPRPGGRGRGRGHSQLRSVSQGQLPAERQEVTSLIIKARDELSVELKKLEAEYLEFRQKSPMHAGSSEGRTFVARRLDQWDQEINQAMARELHLKSQLSLGRELMEEGASVAAITDALNQLSSSGRCPVCLAA